MNKKLEGELERKKLKEILQETKEGKIQWREESTKGEATLFTANWKGKKLELLGRTDWDSITRRTIGLLQDLYYFIERQEKLNRKKKEEAAAAERLKNIEALKSF